MKAEALARLDAAHAAIVAAFAAMPDAALSWLKPGDDYAIGGIVIHLIGSLDGYIGTVAALERAGYRDAAGPGEDEAAVDAQLARKPSEAEFGALAGVTYPGDDVPYPTSLALVVQWMTEHYAEHVPHARQLLAEWEKAR